MVSGVGAGKTTLGCREVLKWTQYYPGGLFVIGRLTSKSLEETTERRWFEMCPTELIEHWNDSKKHLYLKTPFKDVYSEVLFMHLDEPGPLGSLDIDGFWIDEAHEPDGKEVPESTFLMLKARLRGYAGPHRGIITTNSGGKDWVYKWFFDPNRRQDIVETHWGINVPTEANKKYLPPGYIEELRATHPETWVKRFLDGSFDVFEGQIFPEFDERIHVVPEFDIPDNWVQDAGFDFGIDVPTAVPIFHIDPATNNVFLTDLYYRPEADISAVAQWMKDHKQYTAWADPSVRNRGPNKKSASQLYADEGITLIPSVSNDVERKISTWHTYLIKKKFFIVRKKSTIPAIEELQSYRWDPDKEGKPLKKNDHFIDGGGYFLMSNPLGIQLDPVDPRGKSSSSSNSNIHPSIYEDEDYMPDPDNPYVN
jgi:PBSX family phage terminase large subunit